MVVQEMVVQWLCLFGMGKDKLVTNPELYSYAHHMLLLNYKHNKKCQHVSLFVHK